MNSDSVVGRATRLVAAIGVLALLSTVEGCGAGPQTQSSNQVTASGGAAAQVGTIALRGAHIVFSGPVSGNAVYRPGDDAPLQVTIVNVATAATAGSTGVDRLTAVSSPIATSGRIVGDARIPDGHVLVAGYDQPAAATVPGTSSISISLRGLVTPVQAGRTYPVVFTFAQAGPVRIDLPVENPDTPR